LAGARPASAQFNEQDPGGCFRCNDEFNPETGWYQHIDIIFTFEGEFAKGLYHAHFVNGDCLYAISYSGHQRYVVFIEGLDDLEQVVQTGSTSDILALIKTRPEIRLNPDRAALEILNDSRGEVIFHAPLTRQQYERIDASLMSDAAQRKAEGAPIVSRRTPSSSKEIGSDVGSRLW
jgi:hypothetical protein